jgi:hypothetical protein
LSNKNIGYSIYNNLFKQIKKENEIIKEKIIQKFVKNIIKEAFKNNI